MVGEDGTQTGQERNSENHLASKLFLRAVSSDQAAQGCAMLVLGNLQGRSQPNLAGNVLPCPALSHWGKALRLILLSLL